MKRCSVPQLRLKTVALCGAGLLFLLVAGGLLPAHLAHDHDADSDHPYQTCDICLKIAANPVLVAAAVAVPVPAGEEFVGNDPVPRILFVDPTTPRGRAPPVRVPVS